MAFMVTLLTGRGWISLHFSLWLWENLIWIEWWTISKKVLLDQGCSPNWREAIWICGTKFWGESSHDCFFILGSAEWDGEGILGRNIVVFEMPNLYRYRYLSESSYRYQYFLNLLIGVDIFQKSPVDININIFGKFIIHIDINIDINIFQIHLSIFLKMPAWV